MKIRNPGDQDFVDPCSGGCWFCNSQEDGVWLFSREWDAYVHKECLLETLKRDPEDQEALIMAHEFGIIGV